MSFDRPLLMSTVGILLVLLLGLGTFDVGVDVTSQSSPCATSDREQLHLATNTTITSPTTTTCLDPDGPQPFILISLGRSGSGSALQVMGNLTGMETPSDEYTGSNTLESQRFFDSIKKDDGGQWVLQNLCIKQRLYPNAGVVGFKWKPFNSIHHPTAIAGLDLISRLRDPSIKVIRSRRNLLDVELSRAKHRSPGKNQVTVNAHCRARDDECVKRHYQAGTNLTLSAKELMSFLTSETRLEDEVDNLLANIGVPHVQVSYEKLYLAKDADEWMKLFRFVGVGLAGTGLTREKVDRVMAHASTSIPNHANAIANYDEVKKTLDGTEYEGLLHRSRLL